MRSDICLSNLETIAARWQQYGPSRAKYKSLWDSSLVLATLGPQTDKEWKTPAGGRGSKDYSGRNNIGTLTNGPTWTNGSYRGAGFQAVSFDGTDDIMTTPSPSLTGITDFAVSAWIKFANLSVARRIASRYVNTTASQGWLLFISSSGLFLDGRESAAAYLSSGAGGIPANNTWHHVVGQKRGTRWEVWLNGSLGSGASVGTGTTVFAANELSFGGGLHSYGNYYSAQLLSDCRAYTRTLTTPEIRALALHPNAAYEVEVPTFVSFAGTGGAPSASPWWYVRRPSQVIGSGLGV